MALIYLIRHARTEMQPGVPAVHWPLSKRGQEQAESLATCHFWRGGQGARRIAPPPLSRMVWC